MATEEVVNKIARDFKINVNRNTKIRSLQKKVRNGTATYKDANKIAMEVSTALNSALATNLADDALSVAEYRTVVAEVLPAGLKATFGTVSNYTKEVQTILNKNAKINLKAVVTKIDAEAIALTTRKAVQAAAYSEVAGVIKQDSMNFAQNITARMMKDNAGFQHNAGYTIKVERIYDDVGLHNGTIECKFCTEREGVFDYAEAKALGVFARHAGCGCTIIYTAEKGPQLQTEWEHNVWQYI